MFGKVLRIVGIVLLGITAAFTLLGGVGTTCVALDAAKYEMDGITPYQWLYILYVLVGLVLGVMGVRATIALIRSRVGAYRASMIVLVAGLLIGILHMATSRALRGASMPVDFIVYTTAVTLIIFLLFRIPGVWNQLNLTSQDDDIAGLGTGVAMIVAGAATLTVQFWGGANHLINGINYADVWHTQLAVIGWSLTILGVSLLIGTIMNIALPNPFQKVAINTIPVEK